MLIFPLNQFFDRENIFCWHLKSSLIKPTNCRMNSKLLNQSLLNEMGRSDPKKGKDWPSKREGLTPYPKKCEGLTRKMRRNDRKSLKFCHEKRGCLSQNTKVRSQNIKGLCRNKEATFFVYSHHKYFFEGSLFRSGFMVKSEKHLIFVLQEF